MNASQSAERRRLIQQYEQRRQYLVQRMMRLPFMYRAKNKAVERELCQIEEWLLDNPPLEYQRRVYDGAGNSYKPSRRLYLPRFKGLRMPSGEERRIPFPRTPLKTIPQTQWAKRAESSDCPNGREFVTRVKNQGSVGSCASESLCGLAEITLAFMGEDWVQFNPYGIYGRVNGGYDGGSSLPANLAFAMEYGFFPESIWSRSRGWRAEPNKAAYNTAAKYRLKESYELRSKAEVGTALLIGRPVYLGYDSHAIVAVRLLSTTRFEFLNSWGADWGDNGFGTLSFSSIVWGFGVYMFGHLLRG